MPRLFKVEFKGDKIIGLCSKSYCTELFPTENSPGQVKFSMKGVNKGQFKNPISHYECVLNTKENFRACNSSICAKDQSMVTYIQYKNALTYFYPKRKVLEWMLNCISRHFKILQYIDHKDSFMNVRYVIRFVYRRKRDSCLYFN